MENEYEELKRKLQEVYDQAEEWYLIIDTDLGWCEIRQFGKLIADMDELQGSFSYTYYKFEYSEKKLYKLIDNFLNDEKKMITQAMIIDREVASDRFEGLALHI